MPRQLRKQMKGQAQVKPQETFDFTVPRREVHARPVNAQVAPPVDMRQQSILTFIDSMQGFAKDIKGWSDEANIERRKAGTIAKGRGEELPEDPHWAFLEGYELMAGASDAYTYEKDLAKLLSTDINSDLEVFNQKKDEISSKYLTGRTDAYIEGFMSRGTNVEANAEMKYQEAATVRMQQDFLTKGIKLFKLDYREHKETGAGMEEDSKAGRELVTELQELAEPWGLSKLQVSEALVKSIGSDRAMRGKPEDLMFFFEPDKKGGMAMIDNPQLSVAINSYVNSAISTRRSLFNEAASEKERIEDEFAVTAGKAIVKALDNNDPALAMKTLEDTGQYMGLETYKSLTKAIGDMRQGSNTFFASHTDQFAFDSLRIAARSGNLSLEKLQAYQGSITRSDYRKVFGDIVTHWQEKIARGRAGGKETPEEVAMKRVRSSGNKMVIQTDNIERILNPETSPARAARYEMYFYDEYKIMAASKGGADKMDKKDMQYVLDKAVYDSFMAFKPRNGEKMPPNPDATKTNPIMEQDITNDIVENDLNTL